MAQVVPGPGKDTLYFQPEYFRIDINVPVYAIGAYQGGDLSRIVFILHPCLSKSPLRNTRAPRLPEQMIRFSEFPVDVYSGWRSVGGHFISHIAPTSPGAGWASRL